MTNTKSELSRSFPNLAKVLTMKSRSLKWNSKGFMSVCMCVCYWDRGKRESTCVCMSVCYWDVCVCYWDGVSVCVCVLSRAYAHKHVCFTGIAF